MTKSLVTGGAGFIGSHLVRQLLDAGDEVLVVDDLSTGRRDNLPAGHERLRFLAADLCTVPEPRALLAGVDRVFHLAAAVGVGLLAARAADVVRRNVTASDRLLGACAQAGTPVLIASSSEVYGRGDGQPLSEDAPVVLGPSNGVRWLYGCSKLMVEHAAYAYAQTDELPFVAVRLFNTIGPRQRGTYGMVVPRLVGQALAEEDLTVYGDGTQTRCFCHVGDVAAALPRLLAAPAANRQVVNLGDDRAISIEALARRIIALTGSGARIRHLPFAQAYGPGFEDILARRPDLSKARALIGFAPSHTLDDTLREIVAAARRAPGDHRA